MKYFIIIFLFSLSVNAQHHANNWIFSAYIGYKFSTQDTFHTPLSYNGIVECLSTISTESGELLFSCDGTAIYQGTSFDTVLNGGGLFGNKSYTNGCVILPFEDYYLLLNIHLKQVGFGFEQGIVYSIIKYDVNTGVWHIPDSFKNQRFVKVGVTEQVAAIKHGNGRDWWVIARNKTHIYVSLFDANGYVSTDSIAHDFGCLWSIGEISVSAQGNKVAVVDYLGKLSLFDFNRCSGEVSNISDYNIGFTNCNTQVKTYGCCFSPNGRYLYIANQDTLFQFDITSADIMSSRKIVHSHNSNTTQRVFAQMERAPDGDIYISYTGISGGTPPDFMSRIKKPDEVAPVCDFELIAVNLFHNIATGLPNMPDFYLGPLAGSPCDTLTSSNELKPNKNIVRVYPNPTSGLFTIESVLNTRLTISDNLGRIIVDVLCENDVYTMHTSFTAGVYVLKIFSGGELIYTDKIVIIK